MLALIGIALLAIAARGGMPSLLVAWLGLDFLLLAAGHFWRLHRILGKRADGRLSWWSWLIYLPLHVLNLVIWHGFRIASFEQPFNNITDDLVIGRRLLPRQCPGEFVNFVDLTAEFQEPRDLREQSGYMAIPILDASAISPGELKTVLMRLRPGRTYIHCAQGHGRTGLFALAFLLYVRKASNVEEGLTLLKSKRGGIGLNQLQLNAIRAFQGTLQNN